MFLLLFFSSFYRFSAYVVTMGSQSKVGFFFHIYTIEMYSNELFSYNGRFVFLYIFHSIDYLGIKAFWYHFLLIKCHGSRFVCWMHFIGLSF